MKLIDSYAVLEKIRDLIYSLLEARDRAMENGLEVIPVRTATPLVRYGFISMLKGGVVMDVTNEQQAEIAEDAGAVGVMVLDKLPYDVRKAGGVARTADLNVIRAVMETITIPVSAKCRIGHYWEAKLLEEIGVDLIDESEVLTPTDEKAHIWKWEFRVPFVNGARSLPEALRRIWEGASMIRTKGEAGTGNVAEAVRHMKAVNRDIAVLRGYYKAGDIEAIRLYAKSNNVPFELALLTARLGRLPVVNFAAGGIATPADAALMMWLGADGVFVGSGIFKSRDPEQRAQAIVLATTYWDDPETVAEAQSMVSERNAMPGIDITRLKPEELLQIRGE
ncbi:pyridoxal 5'-phosphate synthase lyase subunit PdxS [Hyperthermus butylicus]|uniref:Pyridoxal 5'-phosphate synthase subunit PdxS n=1 Tax=Hyperthermus butylicus (strain DSM 5456 / JCM 9403 / PLM1-5) TaxID=415426 RepID=PDXS_HYPBU|nr:pyridoxal 5'-phosphate synthase lyase subunit PdxS [Hyperthermus butylicus]A2BLL5.1 RecName: Full=Pyridoxal 5'-phosphate synthase subunit PdxS; Short=PLP synthase subunit PdxS; AltName: Full=Pdx1 [Hyperthermus butylicus DSM 5456]ABM80876.1 Pyridoxine biosynthesis protein [Hyperthermus butylicus DSM 5456]